MASLEIVIRGFHDIEHNSCSARAVFAESVLLPFLWRAVALTSKRAAVDRRAKPNPFNPETAPIVARSVTIASRDEIIASSLRQLGRN